MDKKNIMVFLAIIVAICVIVVITTHRIGTAEIERLQAENIELINLLAEFYPQEQTEQTEPAEPNPIDEFFDELSGAIHLDTTLSMVSFGTIYSSVWRAEMDNLYEILMGLTQNEFVRAQLYGEKRYFEQYSRYRAEIEALLRGSNAFLEDDEILSVGSIVRVLRPTEIAYRYRDKVLQLYNRLDRLGQNPQFIFNADASNAHIRQEFYWWWE
jgi:hypothetical protein